MAEHVDDVVETSPEDVHAAELVPDRLEYLQVETHDGRTEDRGRTTGDRGRGTEDWGRGREDGGRRMGDGDGGQRGSSYLGEDGSVVVFREVPVGQASEPAALDVLQVQPRTCPAADL